jgi:hypothetical protein
VMRTPPLEFFFTLSVFPKVFTLDGDIAARMDESKKQ